MALRDSDAKILEATHRYAALQFRTGELLADADGTLLAGSAGTIYLKRLGHRPLSTKDFENVVNAKGSLEDIQALINFSAAQVELVERLKNTKAIGLVLQQSDITRDLLYKRAKRPDLWKPEEVIRLIEVLERLQV